jgi:hypothetical protein
VHSVARKLATISADDICRALNGAKRAGFNVVRCEVTPEGQIILISDAAAPQKQDVPEPTPPQSALERWLAEENAR